MLIICFRIRRRKIEARRFQARSKICTKAQTARKSERWRKTGAQSENARTSPSKTYTQRETERKEERGGKGSKCQRCFGAFYEEGCLNESNNLIVFHIKKYF